VGRRLAWWLAFCTSLGGPSISAAIPKGDLTITLEEVAGGFEAPIFLTHAGDGLGRLFVVDQAGKIFVMEDGTLLPEPFLDLTSKIVPVKKEYDERGLLGLAFHPDFDTNGRFFVRYGTLRPGEPEEPCSNPDGFIVGCHKEVLAEYHVSENRNLADPTSEVILLEVDEPQYNNNGGDVAFGPDGYLYLGLGDGGGAGDGLADDPPSHGPEGNGQNIHTLLGAILRIDVDGSVPYDVPLDNPFVDEDGLDEIFAYGFRNPYRFSFDRRTGELYAPDVGEELFEEINIVSKGGNHGWALREGAHCFNPLEPSVPPASCPSEGLIDPIAEYDHSDGSAVIGGYVYRGTRFPALSGKYIFGDFFSDLGSTGRLLYLDAEGDRSRILELEIGPQAAPPGRFVKGFGEDETGEIYVLTSDQSGLSGETGRVFHIIGPESPQPYQVPGDCNQDGKVNISDAICVLGALFLGAAEGLPCEGRPSDPGTLRLLDWQLDSKLDISDGIGMLSFLFLGGLPHPLAVPGLETTGCAPMTGCPDRPACPR
jgi:glucose/arabinose dehydrogenase